MGVADTMAQIPSNLVTRAYIAELDSRGTATSGGVLKTALLGQKTSSGTATADTPVLVTTSQDAQTKFGIGSHLAHMVERYLENDPFGEVWCIPLADDAGGTAASGTVTITGTATEAGSICLYIGGRLVKVGVAIGDTGVGSGGIADDVNTAINADTSLPVTSTVVVGTGVITLTARHKGTIGNFIDVRVNWATGQKTPAGITTAIVAMASGATDPALTTAITNAAASSFRFLVNPYSDHTNVATLETEMASRWDAARGQPIVMFTCLSDTVSNVTTWVNTSGRNDLTHTLGALYASPTPTYETAAAYCGQVAKSTRNNPAVPHPGRVLKGVKAPAPSARFSATDRNTLANLGAATFVVNDQDEVAIESPVTGYLTDVTGAIDKTHQFINTPLICAFLMDAQRSLITANGANKILVSDASLVSPGTPAVDPNIIKGWLVAQYRTFARRAIVQDVETFTELLTVEINADNPNRVDVLYPPRVGNLLNVVAVLVRPYLTYPGEA